MRKALALAILGTALLTPTVAGAQTAPAFVGAAACEGAAPLRTDALATRRAVRAERRIAARAERATKPGSERPSVTPLVAPSVAPPVATDVPEAADEAPTVRRAIHFCAGMPGARRTWMT